MQDARADVRQPVQIKVGADLLEGDLVVPERATGLVIFAHGSGSSRFSRRNRLVAQVLERGGFATLLLDLLTKEEDAIDVRTREYRFDIDRLAHRVIAAIDWADQQPALRALPVACFGASTGAAAALIAAADRPDNVQAVISRGGRPDLAGTRCRASWRQRCSSWAATMTWSFSSIRMRCAAWKRLCNWRLFLARRTCSKSLVPSSACRSWRANGVPGT